MPELRLEPRDLRAGPRAGQKPRADGAERKTEDESRQSHEPRNGRDAVGRRPSARERKPEKKISSGKSEDPPELSAGSSESEDLPDPTGGKLSRREAAVNPAPGEKLANSGRFAVTPKRAGGTAVRLRTLPRSCSDVVRARRRPRRHPSRLRGRGRSRPRSPRRSSRRSRPASTSSPRPAPAPARASPT